MAKSGATGIKRIWAALFFSIAGLRAAVRHESAFRQECAVALVLIPTIFLIGRSATDYLLLAGSIFIVLITELLNSAIEAVVDRIGADFHPLSGQAKDMASAAVLLAIILCLVVWGTLIWQYLAAAG